MAVVTTFAGTPEQVERMRSDQRINGSLHWCGMRDRRIVLDACVLADMLFKERERHGQALALQQKLRIDTWTVLVPAHSFFELVSTVLSEKNRRGAPLTLGQLGKQLGFGLEVIPVDMNMLEDLIQLVGRGMNAKGSDMIYAVLAEREGIPLVSEDNKLVKSSRAAGIETHKVPEFLDELQP